MKKTVISLVLLLAAAAWGGYDFQAGMTPTGRWDSQCYRYRDGGVDALVIWAAANDALARGGHAQPDWLTKAIDSLVTREPKTTLARSLRICALAEVSPLAWRRQIADDAAWLVKCQSPRGAWGETPKDKRFNTIDTAWAIIALGRAMKCGAKVPTQTWQNALDYFASAQNSDGGFGYEGPDADDYRLRGTSHGLTTAAAIVAIEICDVQLGIEKNEVCNKAIMWFGDRDSPMKMYGWRWGRRNMPMAEYRFFLAMATGDFSGVGESIKFAHLAGDSLAEDEAISAAMAALITARAKMKSSPNSAAVGRVKAAIKSIARFNVDVLADEKSKFTRKALKRISDELAHAYSQSLKYSELNSTANLSSRSVMTWWTRSTLPNQAGRKELCDHIAAGGVVLFDLAGEEGYKSAEYMLRKMFGNDALVSPDSNSPVIKGNFAGDIGNDISTIISQLDIDRPAIMFVKHNSRVCAIVSALPLARAISGDKQAAELIKPENAARIVINLILFAQAQKAACLGR